MQQEYIVRLWTSIKDVGDQEPVEALNACEALEIVLNNKELPAGAYKAEVSLLSFRYAIQFDFVV
jgi:hypothetical protein